MKPPPDQLPEPLKQAAKVAYKLFSRSPLVFGWVLTPERQLIDGEKHWLEDNGFVYLNGSWYKRLR